ncbi:MAG: hypothetical protein SO161_11765 [Treponema sp.]|nr:hypothetical protein [Treponema sp.]
MAIVYQKKSIILILCLFLFSFFGFQKADAEIIKDIDYGFSLDIPEGYTLEEQSSDGNSLLFSHPNIPVTFVIKISNEKSAETSQVLQTSLKKLSAEYDIDKIIWSEQNCAISSFKMNLDQDYEGWAVSVPLKIPYSFLTLLCYAPEYLNGGAQQFIISTLNSLSLDYVESNNFSGIFTEYAFPKEGKKQISLEIAGQNINTSIDIADLSASQFIVDLEFAVLSLYANHKLWKEAWQRYYRMIYKDCTPRIKQVSKDIFNKLYPVAEKKDSKNADIVFAQYLLSWVQTFEYKREQTKNSSDFTPIPHVLCGEGNDCDSRSMLVSAILNLCGYDTIMLVSREYSHAVAATCIEAPGQKYHLKENDKDYIFGETIEKITWGMIAQNHSDRTKWIPIIFGN